MKDLLGGDIHTTCVYLMRYADEPIYKIGRTKNLTDRLRRVQVAVPYPVTLKHSIWTDDSKWLESYWHIRFEGKRRQGSAICRFSEWFDLSVADVVEFKQYEVLYKKDKYQLQPVLPIIFDENVRNAAVNRVSEFYEQLMAEHPRYKAGLDRSRAFQISKLVDSEIKQNRAVEQRDLTNWENQAYKAAEKKIKEIKSR